MSRTLQVEISDQAYEMLRTTAQRRQKSPEELIAHWLDTAFDQFAHDPIEPFIGAFDSQNPTWADQHDVYLGQALRKELMSEKSANTDNCLPR